MSSFKAAAEAFIIDTCSAGGGMLSDTGHSHLYIDSKKSLFIDDGSASALLNLFGLLTHLHVEGDLEACSIFVV